MNTVVRRQVTELLLAAAHTERWEAVAEIHHNIQSLKPRILWDPDESDLERPELRNLLAYWRALRGGASIPRQESIDPLEMRSALGFLLLLDVVDGGADFRYRVYGSKVADRYSLDMTGKLLSTLNVDRVFVDFFIAGYRAVVARRTPLLTQHNHSSNVAITDTVRLILPLADEKGRVGRILVGNIPGAWRPTPARLGPRFNKE